MHIREVLAVCMGAALIAAACGCGGSGGGGGGAPVGAGDIIQQEGFTVRAVDPTGLETTDLTPGPASTFDYVAFAGTAMTLFAWRTSVPPPWELAPILFTSDRDGPNEIYVMSPDGTGPTNVTPAAGTDLQPAWRHDGSKIAFTGFRNSNMEILVTDADGGNEVNLTNAGGADYHASWSPDGSRIAFDCNRDLNWEIYVMNADGSSQTNRTNNAATDWEPSWSADGSKIAFTSYRDGNEEIYVMNADGSNPIRLTNDPWSDAGPSWSPDGSKIAFYSYRDDPFLAEVYVMNADGSNPVNLTNDPASDCWPSWSPDGSKIAFAAGRDGDWEIYVMDADGSNQTNLTMYPGAADYDPDWTLRGFFRCVIGPGGRDSGYDPPLGSQREAVVAAFDESWLRSVVGINSTVGATVTVKRLEPTPSLPIADVYADGILRVTEDAGRREPAIRHIAIGNAETEGWIYRVLLAFSRDTGRVASVIAFRGELGPMAAGTPGPQCQVRDTGSEVVIRGSGMYLAIGDGQLADTPVNEIRLHGQTGQVLSAQ